MEAPELFATAVPEEQLEGGWDRALRRLFGPSQCLRSVERPRGVGSLPAIVQGRMQEHWQKGRGFSSCGQWEEAIICYTKAINLDPQRAELYEQRAEAFLQLCDFQSAKLNLMKVLALAPAQEQHCLARLALVLDLQGQSLLDQELYSEALKAFIQAAELQPHCRVFYQRSIVCLAALGEFPEFLRMLNRELEEDVRNPDMYVLRAFFYKRFGQLALCHQDIQRALKLEPQHRAAQALWQRLLRQGQEAKAQAVLKALCGDLRGALYEISFAIESDPLAAEFFTLRGTLLRQLKNFSAAIKDLVRARELSTVGSPEAREAQRQLVLAYNDCAVHCYALGQLDEAVKLLGEALQNERTEQGLYTNRGDCFFRLGELTYAMADYQQALELSPGNRAVQGRVAAVLHEKGWQDVAARRFLQAEACFSMAIEHDPQEALHYLCRAVAKRCLGKVESSKEDVAHSLWLSATDSKILSLARRLFPRRTVQAILRSLGQQTSDKTLQSPPRLPSDDA
ncbi:tetratricopeptide repeat protein 16 isoform X1 [Centrocercus urophasianus]|uniref:tetratricopeptide repeat protein 16 isoform X1 n=1 Tax=Centrocercus urophasianus TaxID=9002 RepID=UPI001C650ECA|nr:tetratricopeptide repeat protein 16 isoform X1 [Centrocercus urophasianus]